MRIYHAGFSVKDLDAAIAWFQDMLGMEVLRRAERQCGADDSVAGIPYAKTRSAHLRFPGGDVSIELIEYVSPRGTPVVNSANNPGAGHVGLEVDNVDEWYEKLKARGVKFKNIPRGFSPSGRKAVYFEGPQGLMLEFAQPPAKKA